MSVDGLNRKLDEQRRLIKNLKAKEERGQKRFEQEVLSIEERDHEDLIYMMENVVNEDDIPPDMATLWDQQRQLLQTKCKQGYRWHPK